MAAMSAKSSKFQKSTQTDNHPVFTDEELKEVEKKVKPSSTKVFVGSAGAAILLGGAGVLGVGTTTDTPDRANYRI